MEKPIEPNKYGVGHSDHGTVIISLPPKSREEMSREDAGNLAAWLSYSAGQAKQD